MSLDRRETARNEQPDDEERKALQSLARLPSPSIEHEKVKQQHRMQIILAISQELSSVPSSQR